jgi:hypothetical protein
MDIFELREVNLRALIDPKERGDIIRFADTHGLNESYLSQILNKHRRLGEKAARNLEKQIGIPEKSLDSTEKLDALGEIEAAINRADWLSVEERANFIGLLKSMRDKR